MRNVDDIDRVSDTVEVQNLKAVQLQWNAEKRTILSEHAAMYAHPLPLARINRRVI